MDFILDASFSILGRSTVIMCRFLGCAVARSPSAAGRDQCGITEPGREGGAACKGKMRGPPDRCLRNLFLKKSRRGGQGVPADFRKVGSCGPSVAKHPTGLSPRWSGVSLVRHWDLGQGLFQQWPTAGAIGQRRVRQAYSRGRTGRNEGLWFARCVRASTLDAPYTYSPLLQDRIKIRVDRRCSVQVDFPLFPNDAGTAARIAVRSAVRRTRSRALHAQPPPTRGICLHPEETHDTARSRDGGTRLPRQHCL